MTDKKPEKRTFTYKNVYGAAIGIRGRVKLEIDGEIRMTADEAKKFGGMLKRV